jgi:acetoacetyl-CoA synthetase
MYCLLETLSCYNKFEPVRIMTVRIARTEHVPEENGSSRYWVVYILTEIWKRLLDRSDVQPNDNFFSLGGNASIAAELFLEVERTTGRHLPIATLNSAPTIVSLAAALEEDVYAESSPLVQMKSGPDRLPVFISPGLGGNVMELWQIGQQIRSPHPIYAIQAVDLDEAYITSLKMENIVESYIRNIERLQSSGPFYLVGMSFGGLIMLEVARRLLERGEKIALLALLDSYMHPRYWPLKTWVGIFTQRAKHHALALTRMPVRKAIPYAVRRFYFFSSHLRFRSGRTTRLASNDVAHPIAKKIRSAGGVVFSRHNLKYYPGKVAFMKCEKNKYFPDDPISIWSKWVGGLEIYPIPGDHQTMLTTNTGLVAEQLSIALRKADAMDSKG